MDVKDKLTYRAKLSICILRALAENKVKNDPQLATSLRKLAASSRVEYSIIQLITSNNKDPQFTTVSAIAEGLGLTMESFGRLYDSITDDDVTKFESQRKADAKKIPTKAVRNKQLKSAPKKNTKGKSGSAR